MMGLHENDAKSRLVRFLDRKTMPRRLDGKPGAMDDEIGAMLAAVLRHAPRGADALASWWPSFEASLGEMCGAMWPTEKEIADAGRKNAVAIRCARDEADMSPVAISARQMEQGEAVSVSYLYGISACEMIARRLVSEETMRAYRSAWFHSIKGVYGDERAIAMEAEAKLRHDDAKRVWAQRNTERERRNADVPNKSAPIPHGFAA